MARRKKSGGGDGGDPAWLVTFSDLMTLLLTFFVLLLSMAVLDEQAKRVVLGSLTRSFSSGQNLFNPLAEHGKQQTAVEPGPMEGKEKDLAAIRDTLFEDMNKDLNFQENKYVQILSINDDVLFVPGSTILSAKGEEVLDKIVPFLHHIDYPMLVAGHTSTRRDEISAEEYQVSFDSSSLDSTWSLSFNRSLTIYRYLINRGVSSQRLTLEAFGQFHPRYSNNSPEGRKKNRRVDIVLDKRNAVWIRKIEEQREKEPPKEDTFFKGFRFEITMPDFMKGEDPDAPGRRPTGWGNN